MLRGLEFLIDYAIWLEFETCPNELKRILSRHQFTSRKHGTNILDAKCPFANDNWFKPEQYFRYRNTLTSAHNTILKLKTFHCLFLITI